MPQARWSDKRERQYEHIKESLLERGKGEKTAEEIAARTVNKERAQHGESKTASRTSLEDISPERRGGLRSHRGEGGRTYAQLYAEAAKDERQGPLDDEQGRARARRRRADPRRRHAASARIRRGCVRRRGRRAGR